jgi:hypothetical protein
VCGWDAGVAVGARGDACLPLGDTCFIFGKTMLLR